MHVNKYVCVSRSKINDVKVYTNPTLKRTLHYFPFGWYYHKCEGGIEKIHPEEVCLICSVMTNAHQEGRGFLSRPCTNNGLFFLLKIDVLF